MDSEQETTAVNQWALINRTLHVYRVATAAIAAVALVLTIAFLCLSFASPLVIVKECGTKEFFDAKREPVKVTDDDVKFFIKSWIESRYTWTDFDPERILHDVAPLTTEGLQARIKEELGKKSMQEVKDGKPQKVEEGVTSIRVTLSEKDAVADFDRIVRINGIPIVVPSQVAFQIVQGPQSKWNRLGLYVNGVVEREEK